MQPILVRNRHVAHFFSEAEANDGGRRFLHGAARFEASLGVFPAPATPSDRAAAPDDYLLFFGRNDIYQKGMDNLLAGYAVAVSRGLRLPLVIAGQPNDGSARLLQRMVTDLGLTGRVELLGEVSEEQKWLLLRGARCLAFLSRWDGPPRPIREAIAAGTPTVVSRGTNMASIIRGAGAGLAVGTGNDEVADCFLEAQDEATALSWRAGAVALQRELSWEAVADRYRAGYDLTLSRVT
jgi:glycosyltransferase involved in cell wall biosynthesis